MTGFIEIDQTVVEIIRRQSRTTLARLANTRQEEVSEGAELRLPNSIVWIRNQCGASTGHVIEPTFHYDVIMRLFIMTS